MRYRWISFASGSGLNEYAGTRKGERLTLALAQGGEVGHRG
jgi:hypothetical protein